MKNSKFQLKAGQSAGLGSVIAEQGQLLLTTDDGLFHVDTSNDKNGRIDINGKKALQDWKGQQIDSTYIKDLSVSGKEVTYTRGDGTTGTITTQDTNTTYTAGDGLVFNSSKPTQIDVNPGAGIVIADDKVALATSGVSAAAYGPTENVSPNHGGTFTVPSVTVDTYGRVTGASNITITLPADKNTDTKVTQDYSSANNSYPVLFTATAGITSTGTRNATTAILNNKIYANPSTGTLTAATFNGNLNGTASKADEWTNPVTLTIGKKSQAINGKAGTLEYSATDMGLSEIGHKHNASDITGGTLGVARGGTGITSVTNGGIAYGGSDKFAFTPVGTAGQLLQSNGSSAPTWISPSSLTVKSVSQKLLFGSKEYDGSAERRIIAEDLGLSNALHFIGVVESLPSTGKDGDVVILSGTGMEYVYSSTSNPKWIELGDESSHLKKDAVGVYGIGVLEGGGKIGNTAEVNITHKVTGTAAKSNSNKPVTISGSGGTGSFTIPVISVDTYGHTKYTGNSEITITMPTLPTIPDHRNLVVQYSANSTGDSNTLLTYNPIGAAEQTVYLTTFGVATASKAGRMGIVPAPAAGQVGSDYVLGADKAWHLVSSLNTVVWDSF